MSEFNENYIPKGLSIDVSRPTLKELHGIRNWLYIDEWIRRGYIQYQDLSEDQKLKCSPEEFERKRTLNKAI